MSRTQADPVTTEIIRNALISAAEEMNAALIRSAYSLSIYEMKDCSVGLFDIRGRILGQSAGLPIFLGNLGIAIEHVTKKYGVDGYREGDVFILNDSYLVGTHLGDVTILAPIFYQDRLSGFAATRAHWLDVGAKDPAVSVDSTEIYQEGIRLGPTRLCRGYEPIEDIVDILSRNSRFPRFLTGDMHAQIAACRTGERRFQDILERFGPDTVAAAVDDIFEQSRQLDREAVAAIPDGVYTAEGCLDNDGHNLSETVPVKVTVTVAGEKMHVDLTGSSPQRGGATNCGLAQTVSACRVAFKFLINPDAPVTGGTFDPLTVEAPERSIFAAAEPAACQWYFTPLGLLIDLVVKALARVMPNRVAAAHFGDSMVVWISGVHPGTGGRYLHAEITAGGWGGHARGDGESALVNSVNGEHRNLPVEVLETKFPLRIHRYELACDTGGSGRFRGGLGVVRHYELLADEAWLNLWFERSVTPAWGLLGGGDGAGPRVVVNPETERETEFLKVNGYRITRGDRVVVQSGGGGGYGQSGERDPELVRRDLDAGYISVPTAAEVYGLDGD